MPRGLSPGSRKNQFEKGKSGNPKGGPKKNKALVQFQAMTYQEFLDRLQEFGSLNKERIKDIIKNEDTSVLDLIYCRHLYDAMNGNDRARESLYNRLWGKVREQIEHFGINQPQIIVTLPDNGRSIDAEIKDTS